MQYLFMASIKKNNLNRSQARKNMVHGTKCSTQVFLAQGIIKLNLHFLAAFTSISAALTCSNTLDRVLYKSFYSFNLISLVH